MHILVTGGAGFIGSALVHALTSQGHSVIFVDNYSTKTPELQRARVAELCGSAEERHVDITDLGALEAVFQEKPFDVVYHLAAKPGVRESMSNPFIYASVNYTGTLNVFELAQRYAVPKVVFASSSSVYGVSNTAPFSEDGDVDHPISVYASSKRAGELLAKTYVHLYGMNITCLRFFTVYGPYGRPDMAPYIFTEKILSGEPIQVFNHGNQRRDFTYIDDIVDGCIGALKAESGFQVFNLGNDAPVPLMDFIGLIEKHAGRVANKVFTDAQKGDVTETHADISRACAQCGFSPRVSLDEGLQRFVEWYKAYHQK